MKNIHDNNIILRYHKQAEFEKIWHEKLVDVVGDCYTQDHIEILESWERHFESVGTPFAVTRNPSGCYKIWKLNEI